VPIAATTRDRSRREFLSHCESPKVARSFRAARRSCWSGIWGRAASGGRGALTFRNGRETVRGRHAIFTVARDPLRTLWVNGTFPAIADGSMLLFGKDMYILSKEMAWWSEVADQTYNRVDLAAEQLDVALSLFLEKQSLASALTLAGKAGPAAVMKHQVKRFKSMEIALRELEPFVRDGMHLQSGKRFEQMGRMRSREALANWLLCAVVNHTGQRELSFTSDPTGGDGILEDAKTGETLLTEHVMVPRHNGGEDADAHALVLDAINQKRAKGGEPYARGKTLVVFLDAAGGEWFPNRVAKAMPDPSYFDDVWVVGLYGIENAEYVYGVTQLDLSSGNAPVYTVRINSDFTSWVVKEFQ